MSKDMLGSVIRAAVSVPQDRLEVLAKVASRMAASHPMGEIWHENLKKLLLEGPPPAVAIEDSEPAGFLNVPGVAVFVAKKKFREGNVDGVRIYSFSEGFESSFLGVTEKDVPLAILRIEELHKSLSSEDVCTGLRGPEIALAHFWELLRKKSTTFAIARCHGQFVCAHWRVDRKGWFLDASPFVNRRLKLEAGDRVVTYR